MKVVIGGQIDKDAIKKLAEVHGNDKIEFSVMSDLDAAMALQAGNVDFYIGACNTGGGGALAMAIALAGAENCETLSMPGSMKSEAEIIESVNSGKKAFGFTAQHKDVIVPLIIAELNKMVEGV